MDKLMKEKIKVIVLVLSWYFVLGHIPVKVWNPTWILPALEQLLF